MNYFYLLSLDIQGVPPASEPGISLINFTTNEDIATKFEADYRHIPHTTDILLFKFRCNIFIGVIIIKEMPVSAASGTYCTFTVLFCDIFSG